MPTNEIIADVHIEIIEIEAEIEMPIIDCEIADDTIEGVIEAGGMIQLQPEALDIYNGDTVVIPTAHDDITLQTAQKLVSDDITVKKIPCYEVSNPEGGTTVYIGGNEEIEVS